MTTDEIRVLIEEYAYANANVHVRLEQGYALTEYDARRNDEARTALLKAVEEMAENDARYRWLREQHWVEGEGRARLGLMRATANHEADLLEFDAAIDRKLEKTP